jgi:hypothetical protein
MVDLLLNLLGDDLHTLLLSHLLDVRSLVTLDIAVLSRAVGKNTSLTSFSS